MSDRFIKIEDVETMVSLKKSAIYDWIKAGSFPRQYKLGKASRWKESEIVDWMNAQVQRSA
ncbi:AlpA family transcriptional regulator [Magnetospirillum sp. 64-120]|uniref:helix-turn-helix transcriptional regulator n=1 Tax=Magnetospirillum sp. 64-120 TaxID=1895778 RepID=UPI00092AB3DE|nr:AlpA family phage regulatory protein [Magnetospirillum sp. 64-120]OJX78543.1 MAG: hypothetical protein BGO92_01430 [Magnetospirillum sp. 64-120]